MSYVHGAIRKPILSPNVCVFFLPLDSIRCSWGYSKYCCVSIFRNAISKFTVFVHTGKFLCRIIIVCCLWAQRSTYSLLFSIGETDCCSPLTFLQAITESLYNQHMKMWSPDKKHATFFNLTTVITRIWIRTQLWIPPCGCIQGATNVKYIASFLPWGSPWKKTLVSERSPTALRFSVQHRKVHLRFNFFRWSCRHNTDSETNLTSWPYSASLTFARLLCEWTFKPDSRSAAHSARSAACDCAAHHKDLLWFNTPSSADPAAALSPPKRGTPWLAA